MPRVPPARSPPRTLDRPARPLRRSLRRQRGTLVRFRLRMDRLRDPETGREVTAPAAGTGLSPARLAGLPRRPAVASLERQAVGELARARARTWRWHRASA